MKSLRPLIVNLDTSLTYNAPPSVALFELALISFIFTLFKSLIYTAPPTVALFCSKLIIWTSNLSPLET